MGLVQNVLNDMEWVAFRTDKLYSIKNHDYANFTITLKCKAGPKNLRFKPASLSILQKTISLVMKI